MIDPKNIVALNNLEILGTKKIDPSQKIEEALRSYDNESLPHPDPRNPYNDPRNKRTLGESSNEKMIYSSPIPEGTQVILLSKFKGILFSIRDITFLNV